MGGLVGDGVGDLVGENVGARVGLALGDRVGDFVVAGNGALLGLRVGRSPGVDVGAFVKMIEESSWRKRSQKIESSSSPDTAEEICIDNASIMNDWILIVLL